MNRRTFLGLIPAVVVGTKVVAAEPILRAGDRIAVEFVATERVVGPCFYRIPMALDTGFVYSSRLGFSSGMRTWYRLVAHEFLLSPEEKRLATRIEVLPDGTTSFSTFDGEAWRPLS